MVQEENKEEWQARMREAEQQVLFTCFNSTKVQILTYKARFIAQDQQTQGLLVGHAEDAPQLQQVSIYVCVFTTNPVLYVSSSYCILILPRRTATSTGVRIVLYMCRHTSIYVSAYC